MHRLAALLLTALLTAIAVPTQAQTAHPLRIGVLPVIDTLPLQVAATRGMFRTKGLNVELVPFSSAMERDVAMQSGSLDGYFGDMVNTLMLIQAKVPMRMVTVSFDTSPGQRMFAVVTSPTAPKKSPPSMGMSKSTIIEYLLDTMARRGLMAQGGHNRIEVKKIPIRMQMLLSSQIDQALMPEPLVSLAQAKGGKILATDENLDMPLTVISLAERSLGGGVLESFLAAYEQAVTDINANPERYRDLMAAKCRIPKHMAATFPIYRFPEPALPKQKDIRDVQDWMLAKGLLKSPLPMDRITAAPQTAK